MFKTKVKRLISVLPAILIVLFSCTFSLTAYADGGSGGGTSFGDVVTPADEPQFYGAYSIDKLLNNVNSPCDSYIHIRYLSTANSSSTPETNYYHYTGALLFNFTGLSYTEEDGVYTFSDYFSSFSPYYACTSGYYTNNGGHFSSNCNYIQNYSRPSLIVYDSNSGEIYIDGSSGMQFCCNRPSTVIYSSSLFIDGNEIKKDEIEVKSYPVLEGQSTFNTLHLDTDFKYDSSKNPDRFVSSYYLDIDVINHGSKDFQFALYFVEEGETLQYIDNTSDILGSRFFYGNPQFIYISDEWYFNKTSGSYTANYDYHNRKVNGPCAWHMAKAGSTYTCHMSENHFKFKKNTHYDLVVIGTYIEPHVSNVGLIDGDGDIVNPYTIDCIDPYVCSSISSYDVEEVYRNTFWLDRDTPFDKDFIFKFNSTMGNDSCYLFDPESENNEVFNTIYAQESADGTLDNSPNIINSAYGGVHSEYKGYTLNGVANGGYNANFGNYSSLSSGFSSVFGLITTFLQKLPSEFLSVFTFGFTALVVVAIVKAVRGG